ncbi:pantoate-beta-alanine ligase [Saitoella coloradoensis]
MSMTSDIKILRTVAEVRQWRRDLLVKNESVGFVPTMGALHAGHLALVSHSKKENDHTIVSIFVNPAQFAPHEDLDQYPRTFDSDKTKLDELGGVSAIFLPTVKEMYPNGIKLDRSKQVGAFVEVQGLSHQLEGSVRPHFFRGVATVVTKLLNIVQPERLYLGQKDVQQTVVVRRMVTDLHIPTEVRVCPTVRESDGLAMSSRNAYLNEEQWERANVLVQALKAGEEAYLAGSRSKKDIVGAAVAVIGDLMLKSGNGVALEYMSLADPETLQEIDEIPEGGKAIMSGAVRIGNAAKGERVTRIIDNQFLPRDA